MEKIRTDFLVIGAGIIGVTIASEIKRRGLGSVTLLEKESRLGMHASGRNSGVIHSGINQKPGSLKARMCVEGSRLLRAYAKSRGVRMVECGTLVAAVEAKEEAVLEDLLEKGRQCGVEGLRILTRSELLAREPLSSARAALYSPAGATVDSLALLEAAASDAKNLGVTFHLTHEALYFEGMEITAGGKIFRSAYVINCAGLHADIVAHAMGAGKNYRIIPFRGEYMEVTNCDIRSMLYRAPDLRFPFLSIHLTRECDGRVLAGPSAVLAFGREAYEKEWDWKEMFTMFLSRPFLQLITKPAFLSLALENAKTSLSKKMFLKQIQALVPTVTESQLKPSKAGIRAQMVNEKGDLVQDLVIEHKDRATHILNAVSPGMTSSLAFANYVAGQIAERL